MDDLSSTLPIHRNGWRPSKRYSVGAIIQWAVHGQWPSIQHVRIDHRRSHILVPEQLLEGTDVVASFEEVGGKAMAEGMAGSAFLDAGQLGGFSHRLLDGALAEMMAANNTCGGVL